MKNLQSLDKKTTNIFVQLFDSIKLMNLEFIEFRSKLSNEENLKFHILEPIQEGFFKDYILVEISHNVQINFDVSIFDPKIKVLYNDKEKIIIPFSFQNSWINFSEEIFLPNSKENIISDKLRKRQKFQNSFLEKWLRKVKNQYILV